MNIKNLSILFISQFCLLSLSHAQYETNFQSFGEPTQNREGYQSGQDVLEGHSQEDSNGYYFADDRDMDDKQSTPQDNDYDEDISEIEKELDQYNFYADQAKSSSEDKENHNIEEKDDKQESQQIAENGQNFSQENSAEQTDRVNEEETPKIEDPNNNVNEKASTIEETIFSFEETPKSEGHQEINESEKENSINKKEAFQEYMESYYPAIKNATATTKEADQRPVEVNTRIYRESAEATVPPSAMQRNEYVRPAPQPIFEEYQVGQPIYYPLDDKCCEDRCSKPYKVKSEAKFSTVAAAAVIGAGVTAGVIALVFKDKHHHSSCCSPLHSPSYYSTSAPVYDTCSTCRAKTKLPKAHLTVNFSSSTSGSTPFIKTPEGQILTNGMFEEKQNNGISISIPNFIEGEYLAGVFVQDAENKKFTVTAEVIHSREGVIAELPMEAAPNSNGQELGVPFKIKR